MSSESDPRTVLLRCLALGFPRVLAPLTQATERAIRYGGVPFEVIAGTPRSRYGARLTFRPRSGESGRSALAAAFGLAGHPWGPPAWLGARVRPDGALDVKPYHDLPADDARFALPAGLPAGLHTVMASLHGGARELYLRLRPPLPWAAFVGAVLAAAVPGGTALPEFAPYPRPTEEGYCVSLRWQGAEITAVSLFADARALPGEDEIRRLWPQGMDEAERGAYEAALAGVRQLGRRGPPGAWHALLGWTWERGGPWHRAASLRLVLA